MEKKIWKTINDFKMFENATSIVIGVSGGIDSISLLHFLTKNFKEKKIIVAHINHNLRGDESKRDENFVKNLCEKLEVKFFLKSVNVSDFAKKNKKGIEEFAREVRYNFFREISDKENAVISTAHTLSDNIETVLFNFARGSGLSGISGIPPVRGKIVRPLIYVTREEIEVYAKKNKLEHVLDSSNLYNCYSRNKIRNIIIPKLKEINQNFEQNAGRCISQAREENEFLDKMARESLKKVNFDCKKINLLPNAIKKRVLKLILNQFYNKIEYKHIKLTIDMLEGKIKSFTLGKNKRVTIKNKEISCNIGKNSKVIPKKYLLSEISKSELKNYINCQDFLFDLKSDISFFEFRKRKPKDSFKLPRRNCTKSLRKLFNELKIPVNIRPNLGILVDNTCGEIVWIESIGISEKYEVKSSSVKIGKIDIKFEEDIKIQNKDEGCE